MRRNYAPIDGSADLCAVKSLYLGTLRRRYVIVPICLGADLSLCRIDIEANILIELTSKPKTSALIK
jgi:hypothetical protein